MILLAKIPLYKHYLSLIFLGFTFILTGTFIIVDHSSFHFSMIFFCAAGIVFLIMRRKILRINRIYMTKIEGAQEELNLLEENLKQKNTVLRELPPRIERIFSIRKIIERLMSFIDPDRLCRALVSEMGSVFPEADNVLLFTFEQKTDLLTLRYSLKKKNEIIREKRGEHIDWWVLKNNQSLLIEDLTSDYRFDVSSLNAYRERGVRSILSSPLSIGSKVFGVMRLEGKKAGIFSLEDLRVLRAGCDLGAIILERAYLFSRIKELAIKDSLTDLFLRNYFSDRLKEEIVRAFLKKSKFGLAILDIDDFKKVNDTYGHAVGDLVLQKIASIIKKNTGDSGNIAARFGGEEFIFLIVESDTKRIKTAADKIRKEIEESVVSFRRKQLHVTASFGTAVYPHDGFNNQQLISVADKRLYQAKREGKNRVCTS